MFKQKFIDGSEVPDDYAKAVSAMVRNAANGDPGEANEPHKNVIPIPDRPILSGRGGTAVADFAAIQALLGEPARYGRYRDYDDNKVTVRWTVRTPRGNASIRDYWWNAQTEWSISADNHKAAMWLCKELRRAGIRASTRFYDANAAKPFRKG